MKQTEENVLDTQREEYEQLAELIIRLQHNANDERAFEELYQKTYPRVLFTARGLVNDEETALDLVQEVYITFFKSLSKIREPRAIIKWLHLTTASKAKDMRTKASAQKETLLSEEQAHLFSETMENRTDYVPHKKIDAIDTQQIIDNMLRNLPEEQSQTLIYRFVEGLPIAEIAELMGCTVSTIKSRIKYGKQKIEVQVTDLEKKGIKLYSFSLPMLVAGLRSLLLQRGSLSTQSAEDLLGKIENTLGLTAMAAGVTQAAAGIQTASTSSSVASQSVTAAAGAASAKAGSSVLIKTISGILAASAIVGGTYTISHLTSQEPAAIQSDAVRQEEAPEDTRTPEQIALQNQYDQAHAYLDVINSLQAEYGTRYVAAQNTNTGFLSYAGLIIAERLDFDADGTEELLCVYSDGAVNQYGNSLRCWFAVYSWDGQQALRLTEQELGISDSGNNSGDIFGRIFFYIVQQPDDPKTYMYFEETPTLEYTYAHLQTLKDGVWTPVFDYTFHFTMPPDFGEPSAYDAVTDSTLPFDQTYNQCNMLRQSGTRIELSNVDPDSAPQAPEATISALQNEMEQAKTQLGDAFQTLVPQPESIPENTSEKTPPA